MIHYSQIQNSPRLQRLFNLLSDGRARTTLEIIQGAQICAVSTAVAELRLNGYEIKCRPVKKGIYEYQMIFHRRDAEAQSETNRHSASSAE